MTVLNEHSAAYQWHQRAQQRHPESEQECFELALSQSLKALNDIENFAMQEPYLLEFLASCYANQFWRIHRAIRTLHLAATAVVFGFATIALKRLGITTGISVPIKCH